jgi:uncharacterized Zn finger protein
MRIEDLQAQTLDQIGTPEANAQAQELMDNQQVHSAYRIGERLQVVVWDKEPLQVEVRIKDGQLSSVCSCPQADGGEICSHVLALLRSWVQDPGKFLNRAELQERLKKYAKKDLMEIILDLADRVPEVRGVLKEEEQGLEEILESIDHIMEELADESLEQADAEQKLRRSQNWADRLAQSGRLSEARTIYFYLLDNILAQEDQAPGAPSFSADLKEELFEEYCQFIREDRHLDRALVQDELEQLAKRSAVSKGDLDLTEVRQEVLGAA